MLFSQKLLPVLILAACIANQTTAWAAGFYVQENNVSGLATAFAGQAARNLNASTIYSNPAGMTDLDGTQISINANMLVTHIDIKNTGTTLAGVPVSGSNGEGVYDPIFVPNFYAAMPLRDDLWVGLGISAPFGLISEYDYDWFGRYDSIKSDLQTVDVAPSIAYKVNDWLSVGGGLDIQYAYVELSKAIPTPFGEGRSVTFGSDLAFGGNLGLIIKPEEKWRVGLHYRSQITHEIEGTATVTAGPILLVDTPAKAQLKLPDIVSLGVSYDVTPDVTLLAQANWFNWSRFDKVNIVTAVGSRLSEHNYKDTVSLAFGVEYELNDKWTLKAGYQYDPTPSNNIRRSTSIPDETRHLIGLGVSYNMNENISFDASFAHLFFDKSHIDITDTVAPGVISRVRAEMDIDINVLSAALRYRF